MSEISFPFKDLTRRKTQTALTILGLTISTAITLFLVLFGSSLGFEVTYLFTGGQLTSGFYSIFFQFILIVNLLNLLAGPIITSFLTHLAMSGRMRDIGIMKASGCLSGSITAIFVTELSLLVIFSIITGITSGVAAFYISTTFLKISGLAISQTLNIMEVIFVSIVLIIFSHIFGISPILKASKAKPTEAMSQIYQLGTTAGAGKNIPSRLGFTFKVAYRTLVRRKSATLQAILCLTLILTLTTVTIAGGIIADQTTTSYAERAIGKDIILVGHPTITNHYISSLSQFLEEEKLAQIDYLNSEYKISDTLFSCLGGISGVHKVDSRLVLESSVREIPGIIPDPAEETRGIFVGSNRVEDALILGVEPENVVNDWLIVGRNLEQGDEKSILVGDSLAASIFDMPFNQTLNVFEENKPPFYEIVGICIDPLNNGKVVYMPLESLYKDIGQQGYNLLFLEIDSSQKTRILAQIETEISGENLKIVELNPILDKHVGFLNNIWSLVILLPLFSIATAAISLLSYLMLSISGQQHEFGLMRVLGAKPRSIIKIVFSQALLIISVSAAIGIFVGLFLTFVFLIPEPIISQSALISIGGLLLLILGILCTSSLYPAMKAVKKTVLDTISES
jgi:ABC-type antimicrobial peptide transport system permease subunit